MSDKIYKTIIFIASVTVPIVCAGIIYALVTDAFDAFDHFGIFNFLNSAGWRYNEGDGH